MSILAIIPCLNEAHHLPALLDKMLADRTIDLLVVADGGSTDGSISIAENYVRKDSRVRFVENPDKIQSAGINRAVALFGQDYEWLLRIDAHCLYPDGYASTLFKSAQSNGADAVVVPMITRGMSGFQLAVATAQNSVLGTGGSAHRHVREGGFVDHGHHALMKLSLFRRIGGYCEAMPCNEDAELDHRQRVAGGRIWLEPAAAITYFPRTAPKALWKQYFRYGLGRARNLLRHRMKPRMRQLFPLSVPVALLLLAFVPLHPIFAIPAFGWLGACMAIGALTGAREGGGWRLLAGGAAAIMHLAWALGFFYELLTRPGGVAARYRVDELSERASRQP